MLPTSPDEYPNTRLFPRPSSQTYNTFANPDCNENVANLAPAATETIMLDEADIEYESTFLMQRCIHRHPTFSRYSMRSRVHTRIGEIYRKCCFTSTGMKATLCVNVLLVMLNLFLIIYEIVLIHKSGSSYHAFIATPLPIEFFICDVTITVILIIEVLLHWRVGYNNDCRQYLCHSTWDNKLDVVVMIISILCCIGYQTDFGVPSDDDNLLFLLIRIARDIIRIVRCAMFFSLLYANYSKEFAGINKRTKSMANKSQYLWDAYVNEKESNPSSSMWQVIRSSTNLSLMRKQSHSVNSFDEYY